MTSRDTPIPWGEYSEEQAENLIAAWLLRTHPGAQHVDGSGGDDGVDVLWPVPGGVHVFEIKSFNVRLTDRQKRKIASSLATAVKNRPDMLAWTVVLPLNRSPAEERWMTEELAKLTSVPLEWIGRTRLEAELQQHPELVMAFAPGAVQHRALEMVTAYHLEQARPPHDAAEAISRLRKLGAQADQIDPYYGIDLEVQAGGTVIARLWPKDEHAPPITGEVAFRAEPGSEAQQRIDAFMTYGRPLTVGAENIASITVDLPEVLRSLVGDGQYTEFTVRVDPNAPAIRTPARLHAVDQNGRVLNALAIEWTDGSQGPFGGSFLSGRDRSGFLGLTLTKGEGHEGEIHVATHTDGEYLPSEIAPAFRFLRALHLAAGVHIVAEGRTVRLTIPPSGRDIDAAENQVRMTEALERIQQATGSVFPMPAAWSDQDAQLVSLYDQLLATGSAHVPFPGRYVPIPIAMARDLLARGPFPRAHLTGRRGRIPTGLFGHTIDLPGQMCCEISNMLVADPITLARLCHADPEPAGVNVYMCADAQTDVRFFLEPWSDEANGEMPDPVAA